MTCLGDLPITLLMELLNAFTTGAFLSVIVGKNSIISFILAASITTLTSLDFLGFGLPPGSPSLGELLNQGKNNLQAPWLGITGFITISMMLTLLVFIGEAIRDAFDPRKLNL